MDALLVALLESENVVCPLLGVVDFLPGFHLFLLEQRNSVGEQLRVSLDALNISSPALTLSFLS